MEDKIIEEYIGKDADKILNSNVNWVAAILGQSIGPIWFFYKKSYLIGFAFFIVTYLVGQIASSMGINEAYYIMFFIYLFTANKVYLWDVRRKVRKILETTSNEDEAINIARSKGGSSVAAAVVYGVVFVALLIIIGVVMLSAARSLYMLY